MRDIVSTSGTELDHIVYDSFGNIVTETNAANGDRFTGFAGLGRDTVTGLNLAVFREEDPTTGKWDSLDPLGFAAADANLYRYVGNDVVNDVDPIGDIDIEIRHNWLGFTPAGTPYYHAFIVVTDPETGTKWYLRGGPENDHFPWGRIVVETGVLRPGKLDGPDPGSGSPGRHDGKPVIVGRRHHDNRPPGPVRQQLEKIAKLYNSQKIPYRPTFRNSNTIAYAAYANLTGGERPQPPVLRLGGRRR